MKQEIIDHMSEMLLKQYGIKPKQQSVQDTVSFWL
jgi:hypothetical protein